MFESLCNVLCDLQVGDINEVIGKADKLAKEVAARKDDAAKGKVGSASASG